MNPVRSFLVLAVLGWVFIVGGTAAAESSGPVALSDSELDSVSAGFSFQLSNGNAVIRMAFSREGLFEVGMATGYQSGPLTSAPTVVSIIKTRHDTAMAVIRKIG